MNRQLATVIQFENDHLEKVRAATRSEEQRPVRSTRIFDVAAGERVLDRVTNVFIRNAVLTR